MASNWIHSGCSRRTGGKQAEKTGRGEKEIEMPRSGSGSSLSQSPYPQAWGRPTLTLLPLTAKSRLFLSPPGPKLKIKPSYGFSFQQDLSV